MLEMDAVIAAHDLNKHPFYEMWRAGTLPRATLGRYAAEYGLFIERIALGWEALGHAEHADEERAHARLWDDFRRALGVSAGSACDEVHALLDVTRPLFASRASAVGALYAFEAQQPSTAQSKLEGLREHYAVGADGEAYFALHAGDYGERDMLARAASSLSDDERKVATAACEATCRAMWHALDGVLGASARACPAV